MAGQEVAQRQAGTPAPIPAALLAQLEDAVKLVPTENGAGMEGMLSRLLAATSIADLNKPWESTSGRLLAGRTLSIRGIIQRPSTFAGGVTIFLVVDSVDMKTGEEVTWTTSAIMTVMQLVMAYKLGFFPLTAEVVVAERPTAGGFYPYHLNVVGGNVPAPPAQ